MEYVNGPVNVVRMEGFIGKTKKVIYIYFDFHMGVDAQYRCNSITSIDISKYLAQKFKKLENDNKIYDFFLEIGSLDVKNHNFGYTFNQKSNFREKYILELWKFFNINYGNRHLLEDSVPDVSNPRFILKKTKPIFKTRFHYVDIRRFFGLDFIIFTPIVENILFDAKWNYYLSDDDYKKVIESVNKYKNFYLHVVDLFKNSYKYDKQQVNKYNRNPVDNNDYTEMANTRMYLIEKLKNKYTNKSIQVQIDLLIIKIIESYEKNIKTIDQFLVEFNNLYNNINLKRTLVFNKFENKYNYGMSDLSMIIEFNEIIQLYQSINSDCESLVMDIYTLKRVLDKDYATNNIIYCGAAHSCNYVFILNKYFDFKVTHFSYSALDLKSLNKTIQTCNFDNYEEILSKNLFPPKFKQCSDMSSFPPDFS